MKVIAVGRSQDCNVVVNDEKVSREHLQLVQNDNGDVSVVDLGSTNGTFVNGKRVIGEMRLSPNDEVRIGNTILPWRNYFVTSSEGDKQPVVSNIESSSSHENKPAKPKRTLLWIIIAAVVVLFAAVSVVWLMQDDEEKPIPAPTLRDDQAESHVRDSVYESLIAAQAARTRSAESKIKSQTKCDEEKYGYKNKYDVEKDKYDRDIDSKNRIIIELATDTILKGAENRFLQLISQATDNQINKIFRKLNYNEKDAKNRGKRVYILNRYKGGQEDERNFIITIVKEVLNEKDTETADTTHVAQPSQSEKNTETAPQK